MEAHQSLLTKDEESGTSLRATHPFSIWRSLCSSWRSWKSTIYILAGPLVCIIAIMVGKVAMKNPREDSRAIEMMGALCWIFMWWLTSAVPVAVTSMAPLYLFPLLEIATADDVAKYYMNDVISLVLGSFIMAIAVEEYKMHKRLALNILIFFTNSSSFKPRMLLLGFCGATAFVSMWMHNVAAAVMMMPVATGLLHGLGTTGTSQENSMAEEDEEFKAEQRDMELFSKAVVLGVTYSAAIGGMSTLTGTGVNLILVGIWQSYFPEQPPITFMNWFFFGFPLALLMFFSLWLILCVLFFTKSSAKSISASVNKYHLQSELQQLGPMSFAEKTVLTIFSLLIVLWMTKSLSDGVPGWGDLFLDYPGDGTVSVLMATLLFVIPSKQRPGEKIMDWEKCKKLAWHIILLLGAGFAIAGGVRESGLAEVMAKKLEFLESCPYLAIAPAVALISSSITELTSNNATTTLLLPLLIQVALSMGVHPLLLMIPGAVGAQYAFLLPTGTPSNSVGFATGHLDIKDMVVTGIPLKLFGIIVITVLGPTLGAYVFDTATWTPIP